MHSQILYAPDGMRMAGATGASNGKSVASSHMAVVLPHERHDDGLVHNHTWASREAHHRPDVGAGYFAAPATQVSAAEPMPHAHTGSAAEDRYDDGLVHNHNWAVTRL
jgi:formaldehyde-activating enzyme involved in methanogenesis